MTTASASPRDKTNRGSPPKTSPPERSKRRFQMPSLRFEHWALAPLLLLLVLLVAYPLFEMVRMAFSTATPVGGDFEWRFTGFEKPSSAGG
jgi:ABC-type sugar transport system permease subunit